MDLSDAQLKLIDRVANENGFSDYKVQTTPGSFKGDNFLGILTAVTIKSNDKTLDLILKSAQTNEAFRKAAPLREAYEREIYLYTTVFEEFKKFQEEYSIKDPFNSMAKVYGVSMEDGQESLIMENLKVNDYLLWDKKIPMNTGHVKETLKEYAKLHAISFAMKQKNPELFDKLSGKLSQHLFENSEMMTDKEKFNAYLKGIMSNGYKALEDNAALTECLQKVESKVEDFFYNVSKQPEQKLIITHGDCWCNNFLFKYKDPKDKTVPSSLRVLDWQLSALSTPANDFCYFFIVNTSKEILRNYKTYVQFYYDTLSSRLRSFNCDPQEVYPMEQFENHLKKYMIFGLYMGLMVMKIMVCDSDEAPDFVESCEQGDIMKSMDFEIKNFTEYKERVKNVVQFVMDNNFI